MRFAQSLVTPLLALSVIAFGQGVQSSSSSATVQPISVSPGKSVISGCLSDNPDSYRLTQANGTFHLLIDDNHVLRDHVGDAVQLSGYRDNNRDASASSDNGTSHGMRFFKWIALSPTPANAAPTDK
jgi:hypothetical protein